MRDRSTTEANGVSRALARRGRLGVFLVFLFSSAIALAQQLPSVASINLCADQLVLNLADREQVLTVSWLAADPEESMLAELAADLPPNYGSAEEMLRYDPDVVIAGSYTGGFTRALLVRMGYEVVELAPEETVADIETNLRIVGRAIGQAPRAERLIAALRARAREQSAKRPPAPIAAVVVRPGGFTVGERSLAHELMQLAGVRNVAAEQGLDRWGSLSMETLLRSKPALIVVSDYHAGHASLANAVLHHPAFERLGAQLETVTVPARIWTCGLPQSLDAVALLQAAARR
jgi:iron complex transport system substrate-binding protein